MLKFVKYLDAKLRTTRKMEKTFLGKRTLVENIISSTLQNGTLPSIPVMSCHGRSSELVDLL